MSATATAELLSSPYTVKNTFLDFSPHCHRPRSVSSPQWLADPSATTSMCFPKSAISPYGRNNLGERDGGLSPVPSDSDSSSTCSTDGESDDNSEDTELIPGSTTLTLRDLPPTFCAETLASLLDDFRGRFDFYYVPLTFRTRTSIGYAFVNFGASSDAVLFHDKYNGVKLDDDDAKPIVVASAHAQGLDAQINLLRNSPVNSGDSTTFKPRLFELGSGKELEFPRAQFIRKKSHSHRSHHRQQHRASHAPTGPRHGGSNEHRFFW
ncbi:hypothetical protein FOL47_002190 [Perkinsus chesapeaki]|uniref:RRM domain-containing protein n=1 Tax=Perkinsus chesapeaki TaxID=330153 RepID=A0A7J6MEV9_PERCH|nr:hypothetical protein FOL47_002190 [Perkinsus chesapeaki]